MGSSPCSSVINTRRGVYTSKRKHEIRSRGLKFSRDVLNALEVLSCPCIFLRPQQCLCKCDITSCSRGFLFLLEACDCQETLDSSFGISLLPALLYLHAIYSDPETQQALSVACRERGNIATEITAPDNQCKEWEICHHTFC